MQNSSRCFQFLVIIMCAFQKCLMFQQKYTAINGILPGSPFMALKHKHVSSTITGPSTIRAASWHFFSQISSMSPCNSGRSIFAITHRGNLGPRSATNSSSFLALPVTNVMGLDIFRNRIFLGIGRKPKLKCKQLNFLQFSLLFISTRFGELRQQCCQRLLKSSAKCVSKKTDRISQIKKKAFLEYRKYSK